MNKDGLNWQKLSGIGFLVCVIGFMVFKYYDGNEKEKKLEANHRYTIAVLTRYSSSTFGEKLFFSYDVQGRQIKNRENQSLTKEEFNKLKEFRYYVMYWPQEPDVCVLFLNLPVPDSIKNIPPDGWKKIPAVDYARVKKYNLNRFKPN